mmetsp:Transcript_8925/g.23035  ORF Transcript_8925/g.23035 Transcript_8925/m.23035 type:complete len:388 (-) Transcript_8925:119-1282(-)
MGEAVAEGLGEPPDERRAEYARADALEQQPHRHNLCSFRYGMHQVGADGKVRPGHAPAGGEAEHEEQDDERVEVGGVLWDALHDHRERGRTQDFAHERYERPPTIRIPAGCTIAKQSTKHGAYRAAQLLHAGQHTDLDVAEASELPVHGDEGQGIPGHSARHPLQHEKAEGGYLQDRPQQSGGVGTCACGGTGPLTAWHGPLDQHPEHDGAEGDLQVRQLPAVQRQPITKRREHPALQADRISDSHHASKVLAGLHAPERCAALRLWNNLTEERLGNGGDRAQGCTVQEPQEAVRMEVVGGGHQRCSDAPGVTTQSEHNAWTPVRDGESPQRHRERERKCLEEAERSQEQRRCSQVLLQCGEACREQGLVCCIHRAGHHNESLDHPW